MIVVDTNIIQMRAQRSNSKLAKVNNRNSNSNQKTSEKSDKLIGKLKQERCNETSSMRSQSCILDLLDKFKDFVPLSGIQISNLSSITSIAHLRNLCENFGPVVFIFKDKLANVANISFCNSKQALEAYEHLAKVSFLGSAL